MVNIIKVIIIVLSPKKLSKIKQKKLKFIWKTSNKWTFTELYPRIEEFRGKYSNYLNIIREDGDVWCLECDDKKEWKTIEGNPEKYW